MSGADGTQNIVVRVAQGESEDEHRCGLSSRNMKKMMVAERPVVELKRTKRRSRRSTKERVIEIAVFVDHQMYKDNQAE